MKGSSTAGFPVKSRARVNKSRPSKLRRRRFPHNIYEHNIRTFGRQQQHQHQRRRRHDGKLQRLSHVRRESIPFIYTHTHTRLCFKHATDLTDDGRLCLHPSWTRLLYPGPSVFRDAPAGSGLVVVARGYLSDYRAGFPVFSGVFRLARARLNDNDNKIS